MSIIIFGFIASFVSNLVLYHHNPVLDKIRDFFNQEKYLQHWFWAYAYCPFCMHGRFALFISILFKNDITSSVSVGGSYAWVHWVIGATLVWAVSEIWSWVFHHSSRSIIQREIEFYKNYKNRENKNG